MKTTEQLTAEDLLRSLRSTTCPTCTMNKVTRKTLCSCCFYALPPAIQGRLYKKFGHGYEEAFAEAMQKLGVARPTLPTDNAAA